MRHADMNYQTAIIGFQEMANDVKYKFLSYIVNEKLKGKKIIAFWCCCKGQYLPQLLRYKTRYH